MSSAGDPPSGAALTCWRRNAHRVPQIVRSCALQPARRLCASRHFRASRLDVTNVLLPWKRDCAEKFAQAHGRLSMQMKPAVGWVWRV